MKLMGRVALLGCTRSSKFDIDYYCKVHGKGVSLIGAHTLARPKIESSQGLWTNADDIKAVINMVKGGRINVKDIIFEIHSPTEAQALIDLSTIRVPQLAFCSIGEKYSFAVCLKVG